MIFDHEFWSELHPDDLWIYDKLILSRKLGYSCGPSGVPVPTPGTYIVRPITNLEGMGYGAKFMSLKDDTWHLPPGHFWCETFSGRHLSVDYVFGDQILCVEGFRTSTELHRWDRWEKTSDHIPLPEVLHSLDYKNINCEFIDGKLIEVHLRHNPDFEKHDADFVIPVWEGQTTIREGFQFIPDPEETVGRLGFLIPE